MPRQREKCYLGCTTVGNEVLHKFPQPTTDNMERFLQWKSAVGVEHLHNSYIYRNIRVCNQHFERVYISTSNRLVPIAVPTLILPSCSSVQLTAEQSKANKEIVCHPERDGLCQVECSLDLRSQTQHTDYRRKAAIYHKEVVTLKNKINQLKKKHSTEKSQLKAAARLSQKKSFLKILDELPFEPSRILMKLQHKFSKTKSRGRRYDIDDKIFALTILKQGQKTYKYMQKFVPLPSKRTLQKLLNKIYLSPGMNKIIFKCLKKSVRKLTAEKKMCTLMFDEISLTPGLNYLKDRDEIVGFIHNGHTKMVTMADHALVFIIKGIKARYKQPICYTFTKGTTDYLTLKQIITSVVRHVHDAGLTIVCTICDQCTSNVKAINSLKEDTKEFYLRKGEEYTSSAYEIDAIKIFHLYDPPHLLKGIRNNMLSKDLLYTSNNERKVGKWNDLKLLLAADPGVNEVRLVNKLTESHVVAGKIPKMKVKYAAQVFSQRVSSAMRFMAQHGVIEQKAMETAEILLFFDKLFDSFNGDSYQPSSKPLRSALKCKSVHHQFWEEGLQMLNSMRYANIVKKKDGTVVTHYLQVPSLKNWISNIKTMKELWKHLSEKYGVTSLLLRNFNQDPVENFFCQIRSNGIRNISPTCLGFEGAYKTLLLNNLTSPHSLAANCERDNNKLLQPIKHLYKYGVKNPQPSQPDSNKTLRLEPYLSSLDEEEAEKNRIYKETTSYISGYIIKKCISRICKSCKTCKEALICKPNLDSFIAASDYTGKSLIHSTIHFVNTVERIQKITVCYLRFAPHELKLRDTVKEYLKWDLDLKFLTCADHKDSLTLFLFDFIISFVIHTWCNNVNKILSGKHLNNEQDFVKKAAMEYYTKRK